MNLLKIRPSRRSHRHGHTGFSTIFDELLRDVDRMVTHGAGGSCHFNSRPAANITESDEAFGIELAFPGASKDDFKIKVEEGVLSISVEKAKATSTTNSEDTTADTGTGTDTESTAETSTDSTATSTDVRYLRREFGYSSFSRSFRLPDTVDANAVSAKYENGLLIVNLPKTAPVAPEVTTVTIE